MTPRRWLWLFVPVLSFGAAAATLGVAWSLSGRENAAAIATVVAVPITVTLAVLPAAWRRFRAPSVNPTIRQLEGWWHLDRYWAQNFRFSVIGMAAEGKIDTPQFSGLCRLTIFPGRDGQLRGDIEYAYPYWTKEVTGSFHDGPSGTAPMENLTVDPTLSRISFDATFPQSQGAVGRVPIFRRETATYELVRGFDNRPEGGDPSNDE